MKKEWYKISVLLPSKIYERLINLCELEDRSVSNLSRKIIEEYLDMQEKND
jgi:predicted DNA-binding protein